MKKESRSAITCFTKTAREFCALIESSKKLKGAELMSRLYQLLPDLISAAAQLPRVKLERDRSSETKECLSAGGSAAARERADEWRVLRESLRKKFKQFDEYWLVFDPRKPTKTDPTRGSLSDDVADIFLDLQQGFGVLKKYDSLNDAVWQWRFGFYSHWGKHAADALLVFHSHACDDYFDEF